MSVAVVSERLQQVLIEATCVGPVSDGRSGRAHHPVCGDEVVLSVQLVDGRAAAIGWQARGCPASMAVAALAARALVGCDASTAPAVLRQAIAAHGGLAAHEHHAEGLALRAFHQALGAER